MARFNLKNKQQDPALIYCILRIRGDRFVYSTGLKCPIKHWDTKRGRVKALRYNPGRYINEVLDRMEDACDTFEAAGLVRKGWDFQELREELDRITLRATGSVTAVGPYIEASAKRRKGRVKPSTLLKYDALIHHLKESRLYATPLSRLDRARLHQFDEYMESRGMAHNTKAKYQRTLIAFLREADRDGREVHPAYLNPSERLAFRDADSVYLTEGELETLRTWTGPEHLKRVRDAFLMACRTGLRYSDWEQIVPSNIHRTNGRDVLRLTTVKTGEEVAIPVHPDVWRCLERLGGKIPEWTNQHFNISIKEVCRLAGIGKAAQVSAHTARRTFCTLLFLSGVPPLHIAKMSGHRTEKALLTYIRMTRDESADQAGRFKWFEGE